jgi:hypothetical protein
VLRSSRACLHHLEESNNLNIRRVKSYKKSIGRPKDLADAAMVEEIMNIENPD